MAISQSIGRVSIVLKGAYNANTQYSRLDIVSYEGSSYCALKATLGNVPTDTDNWQKIAEKGAKGDTGSTGATGPVGATGNGIASISKTASSGAVDTYTVVYTDGTTFNFDVTNGDGSEWSDIRYKPFVSVDSDFFKVVANVLKLSDEVTTKLNSITNKIDAPNAPQNGQVLTFNSSTGKWEAQNDPAHAWSQVTGKPFSSVDTTNDFKITDDSELKLSDEVTEKLSTVDDLSNKISSSEKAGFILGKNTVCKFVGGYVEENGVITSASGYYTAIARVEEGQTYTLSTDESVGFVGGYFTSMPSIGSSCMSGRIVTSNKTITVPSGAKYVGFRCVTQASAQCEKGTVATAITEPSGYSNRELTEELSIIGAVDSKTGDDTSVTSSWTSVKTVSGLADGTYLVIYSAYFSISQSGYCAIKVGGNPEAGGAGETGLLLSSGQSHCFTTMGITRGTSFTLDAYCQVGGTLRGINCKYIRIK